MILELDGHSLTPEQVVSAADGHCTVVLAEASKRAIEASRAVVERWVAEQKTIYGVTTGFGEFANVRISADELEQLQENLILSHSVGTGDFLPRPIVRAMMVLRVNSLAQGCSGIRLQTVQTLLDMLNADVVPAVPEQGSVGSSGDLIPLSHIALSLIGKGLVLGSDGHTVEAATALSAAGITPVRLAAKEGLALINGTQYMTAFLCFAVEEARRLAIAADLAGALSLDALRGTDRAFHPRIHGARPHRGQTASAASLRNLLEGSEIRRSHLEGDDRVQDAYSLRCMPQVHGASRDTIAYVHGVLCTEINSVTDNPLIFADTAEYLEGGNFHGQPVALTADFLAIAAAELANISERRTERLVNGMLSRLPRFLTPNGGLHSGLMIAQYNSAAIVSENKVLCHPASVDSIPTSANQEDHNSMGSIAARKALTVVRNAERVLAIELLCAAQGIDFLRPLVSSAPLENLWSTIRSSVPFMDKDRILYHDVAAVLQLLRSGAITAPSIARGVADPIQAA